MMRKYLNASLNLVSEKREHSSANLELLPSFSRKCAHIPIHPTKGLIVTFALFVNFDS